MRVVIDERGAVAPAPTHPRLCETAVPDVHHAVLLCVAAENLEAPTRQHERICRCTARAAVLLRIGYRVWNQRLCLGHERKFDAR